jgi:hypothetical protein
MVAQVGPLWTVAEYLLPERYSTIKHEYHGGHLYALAGGSQAHSQIAGKMLPTTADQGETSGDLGTAVGLYARTHGGTTMPRRPVLI